MLKKFLLWVYLFILFVGGIWLLGQRFGHEYNLAIMLFIGMFGYPLHTEIMKWLES